MEGLDLIYSRRSIRKYTGEVITDEQLNAILKAGFASPSAHNYQPWEFIVLKDKETLNFIGEKHPYAKMLQQAGCGIVVCGNKERQKSMGFIVADCSAAIQNMLLASHALNLGAVWVGIYDVGPLIEFFTEVLHLPEHVIPVGMVVVGNKADDKRASERYDENKIHYDRW